MVSEGGHGCKGTSIIFLGILKKCSLRSQRDTMLLSTRSMLRVMYLFVTLLQMLISSNYARISRNFRLSWRRTEGAISCSSTNTGVSNAVCARLGLFFVRISICLTYKIASDEEIEGGDRVRRRTSGGPHQGIPREERKVEDDEATLGETEEDQGCLIDLTSE